MNVTLTAEGPVYEEGQGSFAPEILAGSVFSRRFTGQRIDGLFIIVTDEYAVVDLREVFPDRAECFEDRPYDVQQLATFMVTSSLENIDDIDQSYEYDWPTNRGFETIEAATEYARQAAEISNVTYFSVIDTSSHGEKS